MQPGVTWPSTLGWKFDRFVLQKVDLPVVTLRFNKSVIE
jgi:hypothetical protein